MKILIDTTTPNDSRFQKRTRVPQIRCNNCGNNNLPSIKNCKECGLLLVRPLSNYGATELPTRKEVPGIRAVFFLALIIPLIAGASYFYNTRLAEEVIEEIEIVEQTTSTSPQQPCKVFLKSKYQSLVLHLVHMSQITLVIFPVKISMTTTIQCGKIIL